MKGRTGIVGAGAWGTALAQVAATGGHQVVLRARDAGLARAIARTRTNAPYLPDIVLHPAITATADWSALADCDLLMIATPAQHARATLAEMRAALPEPRPLVLCAKGIEQASGLLMADVAAEAAPDWPLAMLSGPTFAAEVARGLPTAVTLACADQALGTRLAAALGAPAFRPYWTDDVIGAEVGGAVKNVLAIACGIAHGRELGENARAAVITRGYAEMRRYGVARGGRPETLAGLSGLGDLVLTCGSLQSRNTSLGAGLGQGRPLDALLGGRRTVAEGVFTAPVLAESARGLGVEMPIVEAVAGILAGSRDVGEAIAGLLARPFRPEAG